jgi:hypothetical protein
MKVGRCAARWCGAREQLHDVQQSGKLELVLRRPTLRRWNGSSLFAPFAVAVQWLCETNLGSEDTPSDNEMRAFETKAPMDLGLTFEKGLIDFR